MKKDSKIVYLDQFGNKAAEYVNQRQTAKKDVTEPPVAIPVPILSKCILLCVLGVVIILVSVFMVIHTKDPEVLGLSVLSVFAFFFAWTDVSQYKKGQIVPRRVSCIAVTRYEDRGPVSVTFVDLDTKAQYTAKMNSDNCPYAMDGKYTIYTNPDFNGQIYGCENI